MKTILLVEDDLLSAKLLQIVLTRLGNHQVIATENVEEILGLAKSRQVDLIIMDISLTKSEYEGKLLDGLTITKMLKEDPDSKEIPIILASAHLLAENAPQIISEAGANDYIPKPLMDHQILIQKVNQWMGIPLN